MLVKTLDRETILKTLSERRRELSTFGVERIGLFGSFRHNSATPSSDIDLLVALEKGEKTFRNFMALTYFLEDLFDRKVELVTRESLSPYIGPHILKSVEDVRL